MAMAEVMEFGARAPAPSRFQGEQDWLNWLTKARERAISPSQAAEKMGITERWVRKLLSEQESGAH